MKPKFSSLLLHPPQKEMQKYISDRVKKDYKLRKAEIEEKKKI